MLDLLECALDVAGDVHPSTFRVVARGADAASEPRRATHLGKQLRPLVLERGRAGLVADVVGRLDLVRDRCEAAAVDHQGPLVQGR